MADLYNRAPSWTDYLPAEWQSAINTSPVINALSGYINRRPADIEGASNKIFAQPGDREAQDRNWLLQQARGPSALERMNPVAQDGVNKLGILANFFGPGAKLPPVAPKPTGIRAYHGSPHDFDKFDISKIGTGEGAQAYGRGLYFAESEGVAKSYKADLGNKTYLLDGKPIQPTSPVEYDAHQLLMRYGPDIDAAIAQAKQDIAMGHPIDVAQNTPAVALLEKWKAEGRYKGENTGRMYEVNIKADPDQFLDWDKPLAQQPEGVKRALPDADPGLTGERAYRLLSERQRAGQRTGDPLEDVLLDMPITDHDAAARRLRDAGIPGIKYLDQQSRVAGQGSRNYVVFDDKLIEILRKYGLLPPVAAGTAAALNQQEPPL